MTYGHVMTLITSCTIANAACGTRMFISIAVVTRRLFLHNIFPFVYVLFLSHSLLLWFSTLQYSHLHFFFLIYSWLENLWFGVTVLFALVKLLSEFHQFSGFLMIYFQLRHLFSQGIACRMFLSKSFQWTKADVKRSVELVNLFQISRRTNSRNIGNLVTISMCLWVFQYSDTTVPFSFNNFLLEGQESRNWAGIIKVLSDRKIYREQPTVYSCRFLPLIVSKNAPNLWLCNQTLILDILFFTWYLIFWKLSVALPFFVLPVLLPTLVTTFFVLPTNLPFLSLSLFVLICFLLSWNFFFVLLMFYKEVFCVIY